MDPNYLSKHYLWKLQETVKGCWDKKALCNYKGESFTFSDLAANIEKFHILFEQSGIRKGDKIAICAKNTARWAVSFFAINTYGAVAVPILCDFHPESINHLVDHSESIAFFVDGDIWAKLDIKKMQSVEEPADYDAFWEAQMARLAAVPVEAELTPTPLVLKIQWLTTGSSPKVSLYPAIAEVTCGEVSGMCQVG